MAALFHDTRMKLQTLNYRTSKMVGRGCPRFFAVIFCCLIVFLPLEKALAYSCTIIFFNDTPLPISNVQFGQSAGIQYYPGPNPLPPGGSGAFTSSTLNDSFGGAGNCVPCGYFNIIYTTPMQEYIQAGQGAAFFFFMDGNLFADDNSDGASPTFDSGGCGMPVWSVSEPYISLWLHDEPMGYQPAIGPRISFELAFKQRETAAGFNTNIFGVGKKWDCSWLSYVTHDVNTNDVVLYPGGGQRTYYTTNDYLTDTTISGNTTNGFTVSYPDGSQDVYGFVVTNNSGVFQEAFLTQHGNIQAQKIQLIYSAYNPTNPVIRLQCVIDGDGRTNLIC
jgi:hypothetical protein